MTAQKLIGLAQLTLALFAGLAGLGIIHPDPGLLAWLVGGGFAGSGVNNVNQNRKGDAG